MTPNLTFICNSIIAQATPAAKGPEGILGNPFVMMGLMVVMFYSLTIARIAALPFCAWALFKNGGDDPSWQIIAWFSFFIVAQPRRRFDVLFG